MISGMLIVDPTKRMSLLHALQHPFIMAPLQLPAISSAAKKVHINFDMN